MDFFREQDIARRNTRLLVALFILAVSVLIFLSNLLVYVTVFSTVDEGAAGGEGSFLYGPRFLTIGAVVAGVVFIVTTINWMRFSRGGKSVAVALGGRPASTNSSDPLERRALNIVAEMALAANMPSPSLFILDDERGINAFAAGINPSDAVVALTRGAMVQLTRDELQGVIAHEFSHILNGDMRLSMRLAAMLRGITFIGDTGSLLLHSGATRRMRVAASKGSDMRGSSIALGMGLYVIGLLGGLLAGLIKSAISKQKEYLADASAVQFTRNPAGIGDALKVIGGYTPGTLVHAARAEELSHLFFGQVKHRLWLMFSTHPPLEDRILRVDPNWDGRFIDRPTVHDQLASPAHGELIRDQARRVNRAVGLTQVAAIDLADPAPENPVLQQPGLDGEQQNCAPSEPLAAALIKASGEPLNAMALILALHWHTSTAQALQLKYLADAGIVGLPDLVAQYGRELSTLSPDLRLPLLERCLPAVRHVSIKQYQEFLRLFALFIRADGQVDIEEWCFYQLVRRYLDAEFELSRPSRPRHKTLKAVQRSVEVVLGTMSKLAGSDASAAFDVGALHLRQSLACPQERDLTIANFGRAIDQIADCYPLLKVSILKALASCAAQDQEINRQELTLIKAIAATIDCPVPDHMLPLPTKQ